MTFETITLERIGDVARLSINRPDKRNAVNEQVHQEMRAAVAEISGGDTPAKALILTGTGDRAFCSGQDLSARKPPESGPPTRDLGAGLEMYYNALIRRLRQIEMPVITALNGVAAGAGVGVALAGDIILAARSARIVVSFCRVGLIPDAGVTHHLPRLIGENRALALALTADPLDAETAERWGLVWKVYDDDALQDEAVALAAKLAKLSPRVVQRTRRAIRAAMSNDLDTQLSLERDIQREVGFGNDYAEGVRAFLEKREPRFTGT